MKIDQLNSRPPTVVMTTRADARYIATLVLYWKSQGEHPKSISELIRLSLETFAELLIINRKVDFVQTHSDAIEILDRTGLKMKKINPRNMAQALSKEDVNIDLATAAPDIAPSHHRRVAERPVSKDAPELNIALAEMEKRMAQELSARVEDAQRRTEEFKQSLLNPATDEEASK